MTDVDEKYMRRAIELAWKGIGRTSPNPMVGCVLVNDGEIVGEGFHLYEKVDHAEVIAIREAGEKAKGATMYVTVEPCCHTGRTPPCTDAIIEAEISRVVYGMRDPDPRVNGAGHEILEKAGIETEAGIFAEEIREQNKFFVVAKEKERPYILLKYAMTIDGKIATRRGASKWISSDDSRNIVHHLRNIYDGILVGHTTILTDNPQLTCRVDLSKPLPEEIFPARPEDVRNPERIVLDALGSTCSLADPQVFQQPGKTVVAIAPESVWEDTRSRDAIDREVIDLVEIPLYGGHIDLKYLLNVLLGQGIMSIIVEGGGGINAAFLEGGMVDEVAAFVAPKIFGGDGAPTPVSGGGVETVEEAWILENVKHIGIGDDLLMLGRVAERKESE
jgi:diaminohydroxyphosphoribosylaminopyrimidine deaminase/5-amino-6-(5-phosphoribosylamino)uracil reductase